MPKKKESLIEEDIEQLDEVEEMVEQKVAKKVDVEPICLNCSFYSQGDLGPTCINPESPFNGLRMREEDTCEAFTAKQQT